MTNDGVQHRALRGPTGSGSRAARRVRICIAAAAVMGASPMVAHGQAIFQPNSATTGSEFSGPYDVDNTINGSGMPAGFDVSDLHAPYASGNHWTTQAGAIGAGTAWATWFFTQAVGITHFHMWNHQSNGGHASDPGYGVTLFNLFLRDENGNDLASFLNQAAVGTAGTSSAQTYQFARVAGVRQVHFEILANGSSPYTGLAEVAFSDVAESTVPEPASVLLLGTGAIAIGIARRRRRGGDRQS